MTQQQALVKINQIKKEMQQHNQNINDLMLKYEQGEVSAEELCRELEWLNKTTKEKTKELKKLLKIIK